MTMTVDHDRNKSLNCELSLYAVLSIRGHRAHSARAILFSPLEQMEGRWVELRSFVRRHSNPLHVEMPL